MCGIAGAIGHFNKDQFLKGLKNLSHRGPDAQGVWEGENVILGHRRLSIIDLSESANQPMTFDNRFFIVFNGEIYNYIEVRKELESYGEKFITNSDTEVLLKAFIRWKENCLSRLNGMWSFAVWDNVNKSLFMARDRVGKKPLYYHFDKNKFAFGSEMKALYPLLPHVEINMDIAQMAIKDCFGYENTPDCLIKHIHRFPSGSYGYFVNNQLTITKWWNPLDEIIDVPDRYDEQVEMFRELFLDACKIRMRSNVSIATALSGGIDSSAVICSMAHVAGNSGSKDFARDWQHAFIACFPGTSIDETVYAKTVTDKLRIESHFINIIPEEEYDDIYNQAYLFEEIYYAPTIPFVQLYRKMKNAGFKVSIDGHGSDEIFAGYPFDMNKALIDAFPNPKRFFDVSDSIRFMEGKGKEEHYSNFKFALINKMKILKMFSKNIPLSSRVRPLDYLNTQLYKSTYYSILPTLLRNYDRYSMINGVEIRMPFLDYRILKFAFSIPYKSKIRNGFSKAIVRDAMRGLVPNEILDRKIKIGFNSPMNSWLKGRMKDWIIDVITSSDFKNSALVNAPVVTREIENLFKKENLSYVEAEYTFAKLMPYIWEKSLRLIR